MFIFRYINLGFIENESLNFFKAIICIVAVIISVNCPVTIAQSNSEPRTFKIWAFGDPHVSPDPEDGYEPMAEPIRQSEVGSSNFHIVFPAFDWDIAIGLGDFTGAIHFPKDEQGQELIRQFGALTKHRREQIYTVAGNHDGSTDQWWFRKWLDPMGENTEFSGVDASRRPHPVTGTSERYTFRVGNLLFLMMDTETDTHL